MCSRAADRISAGASVVIFPEGTRSRDGKLSEFKSAGLSLAIKSGAQVIPVAIKGLNSALPPGGKRFSPGPVVMSFGQPIPTEGMPMKMRGELAEQVRVRIVEMLGGEKA